MTLGDGVIDALLVICAIAGERGDRTADLLEQGTDLCGIIRLRLVSAAATIRPVSASTPRCSLRQDRRVLVPCFSVSHSLAPHSFTPVLSTSRWMGSVPSCERGTSSVSARRLKVV